MTIDSLLLSAPRRKKIVILIIIISTRLNEDYDNNVTNSIYEQALFLLMYARVIMTTAENAWTSSEEAIWGAIDAMADALDPEATEDPDMEELTDNLQTALENY